MEYMDKTFCSFYNECSEGDWCHRALTPKVIESANKAEQFICEFVEKPDCFNKLELQSYGNKTFCKFYMSCILGKDCNYALNYKVRKEASESGLPLCQYIEKPKCFKDK